MTGFDPNYYNNSDICKNHGNINMARTPSYGQNDNRPQFRVPYGPKEPHCPCYHYNGEPEKVPPVEKPEHPESYYTNPPFIPSINKCNCDIQDRYPVSNIINVESQLLITLKITLYGVNKEDDKTIILEYGKKYKFIYLTEDGVKEVTGTLKFIDSTIPTECIRYIGNSNSVTDFAYIIIDASSEGNSNIVKIFIRSLRGIEEITESSGAGDNTGEDNTDNQPSEDNNTPSEDKDNDSTGTEENPDQGEEDNTDNQPSEDNNTGDDNATSSENDNTVEGQNPNTDGSGTDTNDKGTTDKDGDTNA